VAVIDVAGRQLGGSTGPRRILDAVVLLEARLEALEDLDGLIDRRLDHVDLLEATRQARGPFEDLAELGVGGGADALELPGRQGRLEQVGCIQGAARGRAGADQGVDLVDEEDRVRVSTSCLSTPSGAARSRHGTWCRPAGRPCRGRRPGLGQDVRHAAFDDAAGQAFGDGGLADPGFADQQRVVLAAAAEGLDDALDFLLAADQRVDLAEQACWLRFCV
jgi:hypothetical protein